MLGPSETASSGLPLLELPIFERGSPGRSGASLPPLDVPAVDTRLLLGKLARSEPPALPEVSEPEAFRHFVRLSQHNYSIDTQMYPLGSCTMKYNPKVNEWAARLPGFMSTHPLCPDADAQGSLELMWRLSRMLCEIVGLPECSLQPAAGAQGELTGLMMIRALHRAAGRSPRNVFIPESAHGTNPASCALSGLKAVQIAASENGLVDPEKVLQVLEREGDVCALMITNPNTLGLFESRITDICKLVHDKGGLVYGDGANTNAIMGKARPGDLGMDIVHLNLHKTFTTPHGGGGPGAGPVCFVSELAPYQPLPVLTQLPAGGSHKGDERYVLDHDRSKSIGRMRAFQGNHGMFVRAYTYLREMGAAGITKVSELAVLNARYLASQLRDDLAIFSDAPCMHEVVFTDAELERETGVKTMDVAKRLLDHGFHSPTVYFPLVVRGALMIEPTETETKQTLDEFIEALRAIMLEAKERPENVRGAPLQTRFARFDEARAARKRRLRWWPKTSEKNA